MFELRVIASKVRMMCGATFTLAIMRHLVLSQYWGSCVKTEFRNFDAITIVMRRQMSSPLIHRTRLPDLNKYNFVLMRGSHHTFVIYTPCHFPFNNPTIAGNRDAINWTDDDMFTQFASDKYLSHSGIESSCRSTSHHVASEEFLTQFPSTITRCSQLDELLATNDI